MKIQKTVNSYVPGKLTQMLFIRYFRTRAAALAWVARQENPQTWHTYLGTLPRGEYVRKDGQWVSVKAVKEPIVF